MSVTAVPIPPIAKGSLTKIWIGVGIALLLGAALAWAGTGSLRCGASDEAFLACNAGKSGVKTTASGLQYKVLKAGEGPSPANGDFVRIKYTGTLRDGTQFDSSVGQPEDAVAFPVEGVVPGFSEALKLMQKGGEYRIWIPANLGYGAASPSPAVPANAMLVFDVTLMDYRSRAQVEAMQQQLQQLQQQQQGAAGAAGASGGPQPQAAPGQ